MLCSRVLDDCVFAQEIHEYWFKTENWTKTNREKMRKNIMATVCEPHESAWRRTVFAQPDSSPRGQSSCFYDRLGLLAHINRCHSRIRSRFCTGDSQSRARASIEMRNVVRTHWHECGPVHRHIDWPTLVSHYLFFSSSSRVSFFDTITCEWKCMPYMR